MRGLESMADKRPLRSPHCAGSLESEDFQWEELPVIVVRPASMAVAQVQPAAGSCLDLWSAQQTS